MFSSSTSFQFYQDGHTAVNPLNLTVDCPVPSTGVITAGLNNSFLLQEGVEVIIPVSVAFSNRNQQGYELVALFGRYGVGVSGIRWVTKTGVYQISDFMNGSPLWRTAEITFP